MSDDLPPVDGHVHPDDARRRAAGRKGVHLDAVDFAPILAALKALAEAARQCAGLIAADGRTGSAGSRLLSQTAERWRAFESAVVSAGLTENTPLAYDNELPMAEQRMAVVYELWDLISHHRRGRFGDAAGLDMLAKQADAAAQLLAGLTPSATPLAPQHPSLTDEDRYILTVLEAHRGKSLTYCSIMQESVRMEQEDRTKIRRLSDSTIRARVSVLESHGMVARPPGTKKKGIAITDKGFQAIGFARANSTETRGKNRHV